MRHLLVGDTRLVLHVAERAGAGGKGKPADGLHAVDVLVDLCAAIRVHALSVAVILIDLPVVVHLGREAALLEHDLEPLAVHVLLARLDEVRIVRGSVQAPVV